MAFSSTGFLGNSRFVDLDVDATVELIHDAATALVLYGIFVDNTQNTVDVFVKMWDSGAVTLGTDAPDFVARIPAGGTLALPFLIENTADKILNPEGWEVTDLSVACVTEGGTGGTTGPANVVKATLITS